MKAKLIIPRGLPGSGKSTWAKNFVSENPNTYIVSRDSFREMLVGDYQNFPFGNSALEKSITEGVLSLVYALLDRGKNVILDETNLNFERVNKFVIALDHATEDFDVEFNDDFLEVPLEECILRDRQRKRSVGEHVIRGMHKKYLTVDPPNTK